MADPEDEAAQLRRELEGERAARLEAEQLLEQARHEADDLVVLRTAELREANSLLARAAYTDRLTGLPNRASMDQHLEEAFADPSNGGAVSFVMVDMNDLKHINDSHGHLAGDAALRELAAVMQEAATEPNTKVGRLAGDEFGLIAAGVSVGMACSRQLGERVDGPRALLHYADAAQYRAKRTRSTGPVSASASLAEAELFDPSPVVGRAFRGTAAQTEQLITACAHQLDHLPSAAVVDRLACVAEALLGPVNVRTWTISVVRPGDDRFRTELTGVSRLGDDYAERFGAFFSDANGYPLADFPASELVARGGAKVIRADDPSADTTERAIVTAGGFDVMVMAGGQDASGACWLLEAYSDDPAFPAEVFAIPMRAAVAMAITGADPLGIRR